MSILAVDPALHCCAAKGCSRQIPLRHLMCSKHWRMVPDSLQKLIWTHYRSGQEYDHSIRSPEYADTVREAVATVAKLEGLA